MQKVIVLLTCFLTYYFSVQKLLATDCLSQRWHLFPTPFFLQCDSDTPVRSGFGVIAALLEFDKLVSVTSQASSQKAT